jgi:hypothetical protein
VWPRVHQRNTVQKAAQTKALGTWCCAEGSRECMEGWDWLPAPHPPLQESIQTQGAMGREP